MGSKEGGPLKRAWYTSYGSEDGPQRDFDWVVWGDAEGCAEFGKHYTYKGHAINGAKKMLENGEAIKAAVLKPRNGSYYKVVYRSGLWDALVGLAHAMRGEE
jgi:hypothetical protein